MWKTQAVSEAKNEIDHHFLRLLLSRRWAAVKTGKMEQVEILETSCFAHAVSPFPRLTRGLDPKFNTKVAFLFFARHLSFNGVRSYFEAGLVDPFLDILYIAGSRRSRCLFASKKHQHQQKIMLAFAFLRTRCERLHSYRICITSFLPSWPSHKFCVLAPHCRQATNGQRKRL